MRELQALTKNTKIVLYNDRYTCVKLEKEDIDKALDVLMADKMIDLNVVTPLEDGINDERRHEEWGDIIINPLFRFEFVDDAGYVTEALSPSFVFKWSELVPDVKFKYGIFNSYLTTPSEIAIIQNGKKIDEATFKTPAESLFSVMQNHKFEEHEGIFVNDMLDIAIIHNLNRLDPNERYEVVLDEIVGKHIHKHPQRTVWFLSQVCNMYEEDLKALKIPQAIIEKAPFMQERKLAAESRSTVQEEMSL